MKNLTAIYWIKNEAQYLPEYLEFHLMQGFDHFIFYDDGSTDNLLEVVEPYDDLVEIRQYPENLTVPKNFWLANHCCYEQRGKSKWIHFHSVDERIFCPDGRQIPDFLKDFEGYGGVSVAWEEFNSSGHISKPTGLIIENYTEVARDSQCHIKTIIQPTFAVRFNSNPHNFIFEKSWAVNENKVRVDGPYCPQDYSFSKIKNHHYRTLSREEFEIKMNKGVLDHGPSQAGVRREQAEDEWSYTHGGPSRWGVTTLHKNTDLLKFVEPVKAAVLARYRDKPELLETIVH